MVCFSILVLSSFYLPQIPHQCQEENGGNCPTASHSMWEIPINSLQTTGDPCSLISSCPSITTREELLKILNMNLARHYNSNRAPLSLAISSDWLLENKHLAEAIIEWMDQVLSEYDDDVFFTSYLNVIQWMLDYRILQQQARFIE